MIYAGIIVVFLLAFLYRERMYQDVQKQWTEERRELLNRIKPETAQLPNLDETAVFEPVNDDESYWEAHAEQLKDVGTFPYGFEEEVRGR